MYLVEQFWVVNDSLPDPLPRVKVTDVISREGHADTLKQNAGKFQCSRSWTQNFLMDMGVAWRSPSTAAQRLPSDWPRQMKLLSLNYCASANQCFCCTHVSDLP